MRLLRSFVAGTRKGVGVQKVEHEEFQRKSYSHIDSKKAQSRGGVQIALLRYNPVLIIFDQSAARQQLFYCVYEDVQALPLRPLRQLPKLHQRYKRLKRASSG